MKKTSVYLGIIASLIVLIWFMLSCRKNNGRETFAYSDTFSFHYGFMPDVAGGWTPGSGLPGWFPNTGSGTSSLIGRAYCYFTPYAKFTGVGTTVEYTYAPVNRYFTVQLAAAGIKVPDSVETIVYDDQKNSIWFKATRLSETQVSATRINTFGKLDIIGGTGKYAGATGHVSESGYFNPVDTTISVKGIKGSITY